MNIFVTDPSPSVAVKHLDDKRLVKMVLETAQILSTVMHLKGTPGPYRPTHKNHPCVKWANESWENYWWLLNYFDEILDEYHHRFSKHHACEKLFYDFLEYIPNGIPQIRVNPHPNEFVNCTPFKDESDTFKAYRLCLVDKWAKDKRQPKWTNREKPQFDIEVKNS